MITTFIGNTCQKEWRYLHHPTPNSVAPSGGGALDNRSGPPDTSPSDAASVSWRHSPSLDMAAIHPTPKLSEFYDFFAFSHLTPPVLNFKRCEHKDGEKLDGDYFEIQDTSSWGTVIVRHSGYTMVVKVVGDVKKDMFNTQDIEIDDQQDGGADTLNISRSEL